MKKCAIIGCGKPRQVCNVVRKWTKDKQIIGVLRWINNQVPTIGPIQDHKHVCMERLLEVWQNLVYVCSP